MNGPTLATTENTRLIVCCHNDCVVPNDSLLMPLRVGAALSGMSRNMENDTMACGKLCDNISHKNMSYCELTGIYWAWKNLKKILPEVEYIGINHYRRYFAFEKKNPVKSIYVYPVDKVSQYSIDKESLFNQLAQSEVIAVRYTHYPYSIFDEYSISHIGEDMRALIGVIHDVSPEYDEAMFDVLMNRNLLARYNMGVMGWNIFDNYCTWLFNILNETERRIDISSYNQVQCRIYGYMAERLWNVWLRQGRYRVHHVPIYQFADLRNDSSARCLANIARRDIAFHIGRKMLKSRKQYYDNIVQFHSASTWK